VSHRAISHGPTTDLPRDASRQIHNPVQPKVVGVADGVIFRQVGQRSTRVGREGVPVASDKRMHAVMVIDMDDATTEEIRCVVRAIRKSAARSDCPGWPDQLAVLVKDSADEISERVQHAVDEHRHPSFPLAGTQPLVQQRTSSD
jgi:hypothetical protein